MRNALSALLIAASVTLSSAAPANAQTELGPSCTSGIRVLFDRYGMTHIPTGSTMWFTGVLKSVRTTDGSAITTPLRIDVREARITFGLWPYVIAMPDSSVVIDASTKVPRRLWEGPARFTAAYSPSQVS